MDKTSHGLFCAARFLAEAGMKHHAIDLALKSLELQETRAGCQLIYDLALETFDLPLLENACNRLAKHLKEDAEGAEHLAFLRSGPLRSAALMERLAQTEPYGRENGAGRVLYLLHKSLPYQSDGYATRSHGLAQGLMQHGLALTCVTRPGFPMDLPQPPDVEAAAEMIVDGVTYHRISAPLRSALPPAPHEHMAHVSVDYVEAAAQAIGELIARLEPDCVMAASNHVTALPAALAARVAGLPFVYEVRGFWEITHAFRDPGYPATVMGRLERYIEANTARLADAVITLNEPMQEELLSRGVAADKITIAPNACHAERFTPRPRNQGLAERLGIGPEIPVIGYVGSFSAYEGLDDLVEACGQLRAQGKVFRLLLVGSEAPNSRGERPATERIRLTAETQGMSDWLLMPGRVPHEQVEAYYSLIDIAPFPRKPDLLTELVSPIKPLEALAMEKAVLVSSVRALADMIGPGDTGLIFETGNLADLAAKLDLLISDPALRHGLGRAGREWVSRHRSWDHVAERVATALRKVMSGPEAPAASPTRKGPG